MNKQQICTSITSFNSFPSAGTWQQALQNMKVVLSLFCPSKIPIFHPSIVFFFFFNHFSACIFLLMKWFLWCHLFYPRHAARTNIFYCFLLHALSLPDQNPPKTYCSAWANHLWWPTADDRRPDVSIFDNSNRLKGKKKDEPVPNYPGQIFSPLIFNFIAFHEL